MALPDTRSFTAEQIAGMSPRDILQSGIKTKRLETVPLADVIPEPELTDPVHAEELGLSMLREEQASSTTYRARFRDGKSGPIVYDIIDGYHRVAGGNMFKIPALESTVHYGMSDETMTDLRVHAINSIEGLGFARVATWVDSAYKSSPYPDKIDVEDAFKLALNLKAQVHTDLSASDKKVVRDWALRKCADWKKKPAFIQQVVSTALHADPELVKLVREPKKDSTKEERAEMLTPDKIFAISSIMPRAHFTEAQYGIVQATLELGLTAEQARQVSLRLVPQIPIDSPLSRDDIYQMALAEAEKIPAKPETKPKAEPKKEPDVDKSGDIFTRERKPSPPPGDRTVIRLQEEKETLMAELGLLSRALADARGTKPIPDQTSIPDLAEEVIALRTQRQSMQEALTILRRELQQLRRSKGMTDEEPSSQQGELMALRSENQSLQGEIETLRREQQDLRDELRAVGETPPPDAESLEATNTALIESVRRAEESLAVSSAENARLRTQLGLEQRKVRTLSSKNAEFEDEVDRLTDENTVLRQSQNQPNDSEITRDEANDPNVAALMQRAERAEQSARGERARAERLHERMLREIPGYREEVRRANQQRRGPQK